jgi:hypothetical protein
MLQNDFKEFEKYHKNIYNIEFHIICGFIFMTSLFILSRKYSKLLIIIYSLLLLFTINNILIVLIIFIILFIMVYYASKYNISKITILVLFIVFYFLPDLSHYLTKEPTLLNINNINPINIITNILYLLPFSMKCLFKI